MLAWVTYLNQILVWLTYLNQILAWVTSLNQMIDWVNNHNQFIASLRKKIYGGIIEICDTGTSWSGDWGETLPPQRLTCQYDALGPSTSSLTWLSADLSTSFLLPRPAHGPLGDDFGDPKSERWWGVSSAPPRRTVHNERLRKTETVADSSDWRLHQTCLFVELAAGSRCCCILSGRTGLPQS